MGSARIATDLGFLCLWSAAHAHNIERTVLGCIAVLSLGNSCLEVDALIFVQYLAENHPVLWPTMGSYFVLALTLNSRRACMLAIAWSSGLSDTDLSTEHPLLLWLSYGLLREKTAFHIHILLYSPWIFSLLQYYNRDLWQSSWNKGWALCP